MNRPLRIGILISGSGTNMVAIVEACLAKKISAEVVFVGSDVPTAKGLLKAQGRGIPVFAADFAAEMRRFLSGETTTDIPAANQLEELLKRYPKRFIQGDIPKAKPSLAARIWAETKMLAEMQAYSYDLLVLAGYMRILSPYFIDVVNGGAKLPRIMNIHPSLLPAFAGTDGYGDTFRYGCKVAGCTVHFVDYGEDTGPIIGQKSFPILPGDTLETVREKGLQLEWQLYPACIELYARNRLQLVESRVRRRDGSWVTRTKVVTLSPD